MRHAPPTPGRWRFCVLFGVYLAGLAGLFAAAEIFFAKIYLYPVSIGAHFGLSLAGVPTVLDASGLDSGYCILGLPTVTFRIIHECSGLFALFILIAGLMAYPAQWRQKLGGIAVGIAAFLAYGAARLVVLGLIAHHLPGHFDFFHLYMMVLLNLGFALYLWMGWINHLHRRLSP